MSAAQEKGPRALTFRPSLWRRADRSVRRELEVLQRELSQDPGMRLCPRLEREAWSVRLGLTGESLIVALVNEAGETFASGAVLLGPLEPYLTPYARLLKRLAEGGSLGGGAYLEGMDLARRALHDEASRLICQALEELLQLELEAGRRLFTVLCLTWDQPLPEV